MTPEYHTLHYATWQYIFQDGVSFDEENRVRDEIYQIVKEVVRPYQNVYENTDFCCQAEGFEIYSEQRLNLEEAARKISRELFRYQIDYIKPL